MTQTDTIIIHTKDSMIKLLKRSVDEPIDLDEITRIDYSNIFGEIITISALLNRIGNMKAEMEEQLNLEKLDVEIFEAQKRAEHNKRLASDPDVKRVTEQILEDALLSDAAVIAKRKKMIQVKRNMEYINSLYWAAKSKDDKLSTLLKPLLPDEFEKEIVEGVVNGFFIKKHKNRL